MHAVVTNAALNTDEYFFKFAIFDQYLKKCSVCCALWLDTEMLSAIHVVYSISHTDDVIVVIVIP